MKDPHPELQKIEINDFSGGAVQYADLEDLAPDEVVVLDNMKAVRGKLVKTFGLQADYPDMDRIMDAYNLTTYHHPRLADVDPPGLDYLYVAVKITNSIVTLRGWNPATGLWESITGSPASNQLNFENSWPAFGAGYRYFHEVDKNPIIHNDGVMRLLPGNVGKTALTSSIAVADHTVGVFKILGPLYMRYFYTPGTRFEVTNSTANDGWYKVKSWQTDATHLFILVDPNVKQLVDSTADGTLNFSHPGRGIWIGYIDREYFDKTYDPTAGFYHYESPVARPEIDQLGLLTSVKISDGCFSPRDVEAQITATSTDDNTITVLGAFSAQITPGSYIEVFGNTTLFGEWEVDHAVITFDNGTPKTVIELVATLPGVEDQGYVRFPSKVSPEGGTSRLGSTLDVEGSSADPSLVRGQSRRRTDTTGQGPVLNEYPGVGPFGGLRPSGMSVSDPWSSEGRSPTALGEVQYYKFTYIYDGVQESLLSDPIKIQFYPTSFLSAFLPIDTDTHNLRITGMNVYRSSNKDGPYAKVLHLDFLREADKFHSLTSAENGCTDGRRKIYIPALDGTQIGDNSHDIQIRLKTKDMQDFFPATATLTCDEKRTSTGIFTISDGEDDLVRDYWNCQCKINVDGDAYNAGTWTPYGVVIHDTGAWTSVSGVYAGYKTLIFEQELDDRNYAGGVINFAHGGPAGAYNDGTFRQIDDNYKRAMHVSWMMGTEAKNEGGYISDEESFIVTPDGGMYFTDTYSDEGFGITFFDTNLPRGRMHPLEGELSIETNGAFARLIGGSLWQGNIVLDPSDKAEAHPDWICKSLPGQFDVNPASNVMRFPDREGGEITGVAELFGNVLILKRQSIRAIKSDTGKVIEVVHNIGNIAKNGYVEAAGSVYVCFYDGIYRLSPNNLAPTDQTPTERLRISEGITNVYEAMTSAQKEAIKAIYNQWASEILFSFEYTTGGVDYPVVWAYNTNRGTWREVKTASNDGHVVTPSIFALDEKAQVLAYESTADGLDSKARVYRLIEGDEDVPSGQIQEGVWYYVSGDTYVVTYPAGGAASYGYGKDSASFEGSSGNTTYTDSGKGSDGKLVACNVEAKVRIRNIAVSNERKERVRYVYITYKSPTILKVNLYAENNTVVAEALTLPASAVMTTYKLCPDLRAKKFTVEICEDYENYLITAETDTGFDYLIVGKSGGIYPNTEIGRIRIYHD